MTKMNEFLTELKETYASCKEFVLDVFVNRDKEAEQAEIEEMNQLSLSSKDGDFHTSRPIRVVLIIAVFLLIFLVWAAIFHIDEVSKGDGKVVPSSKEQIIQSMDGGILAKLDVKEGDIVEAGQELAHLDQTRIQSTLDETVAKYHSLLAAQARLTAEVYSMDLVFPEEIQKFDDLIKSETNLYNSRKKSYDNSVSNIEKSKQLLEKELQINRRLAKEGASSAVEVIRLEKQLSDLSERKNEIERNYLVKSSEDLARIKADVETLRPMVIGKKDVVSKSVIKSPVYGVVKDVEVTTVGGVIPPNGTLMRIVPLNDALLIEAKIQPRDVAFIHPGQDAKVKITAYDYAIYGSLEGKVEMISPDTIKDDIKPDMVYYRVYIRTDRDYLETKNGKRYNITPGMVATVDIKTGNKTVLQYLLKPFNKVNEALRER